MYNPVYQYKVEQLTAMRDYERKQATNDQYGAHLDHWSGHGKPINLDADALQALIDHYIRRDAIERYQAAKQAEKADSDGEKEFEYCVDTYACASFTVQANDADEAALPDGLFIVTYYWWDGQDLLQYCDHGITKQQIIENVRAQKYREGADYFLIEGSVKP